ncbi:cysteine-rich CWC family protein [Trinickia caryophylli]|nr:cysteine-rich CWC family protein [Trinickia caryophylli]PMS11002.1 hypothetical protein C0Z17_17460 [Trinickia caryophylli]TRX20313.1 hypothetical protein FNF07_12170 [Trinickia caryophylli]
MCPPNRDHLECRPAHCPGCGAKFDCACDAKPHVCWCAAMPKVSAERLVPGQSCLCPQCLAAALARSPLPPNG